MWELPKERNATSEVICINNNITNFIATLEALDFPRSAIFSLSDLESTGGEERYATLLWAQPSRLRRACLLARVPSAKSP